MLESTAPTALVQPCRLPPSFTPTHARACPTAILLTAVAVRTQQHLIATTRAQEQAGRTVHVHPRALPKVLDGLVPGCNTAAAPPSSARCRARRRYQGSQASVTAAVPTCFGIVGVVHRRRSHLPARPGQRQLRCSRPRWTSHPPTGQACGRPPPGPCLAHRSPADAFGLTRFACQQPERSIDQQQTKLKTAASPSLGSGS